MAAAIALTQTLLSLLLRHTMPIKRRKERLFPACLRTASSNTWFFLDSKRRPNKESLLTCTHHFSCADCNLGPTFCRPHKVSKQALGDPDNPTVLHGVLGSVFFCFFSASGGITSARGLTFSLLSSFDTPCNVPENTCRDPQPSPPASLLGAIMGVP